MVTGLIVLMKVVVDGEGQVGKGAAYGTTLKYVLEVININMGHADKRILKYVGFVVKHKGRIKGVAVCQQADEDN